jgi:CheY-like chemotaxis protein
MISALQWLISRPAQAALPVRQPEPVRARARPARRVLVVEDSRIIGRVISMILEGEGYEVTTTQQGYEALELARVLRPHAVTLDLGLRDLDGREVLRRLKTDEATREVPVIILSAYVESLSSADRWYAADVIAKPFDVDELIARVARATG